MIKVENISKSFGFLKAVDEISFTVNQGEIVGFLGPNGAGKTTTMRMLTGFLAPDKGLVEIENVSMKDNPEMAQKFIGYLPENNPLYPEMQVHELLGLAAELQKVPKNKRKEAFDFVVSSVGLESVYYRPIGELSKGFKQRVGIATALIHQPKIIVMDEPTEGLDPNQRTDIRTLIKKLAKDHTIILSTHVMQEASAVCNRMLIINNGKIVADGTTEELSRSSEKEKTFQLEIEGRETESILRKLENIHSLDIIAEQDGRFSVIIKTENNFEIQPKISQLAKQHDWIIWKINEQERKLEDIFQKLTSNK